VPDNEVKIVVTGTNKAKPAVTDAKKDVKDLVKEIDKIPEKKTVRVNVDDQATKGIDKVDKAKVSDKETKITAKDEASDTIDKVSKTKPKAVEIPVKANSDKVASAFGDAGKQGASAFAGGFTGGLAGAGLVDSAASLITDVFAKAGEKQRLAADVQNMMGVSPDAAKKYGDRIGQMFWSGIGESKEQIASAFSSLSSDVRNWGNLTVEQQDRIVKKSVAVSSAFKVDIQEPLRAASSMVDNKLVPSFDEAFDLITGGYQTLGSRASDTLDTLGEYSGYFAKLGFDGPHALKMINDMMVGGARDTDYAADAWKEFGIRMLAGADDAKKGLKDLGLNADRILKDIAGGGPKAQEAIDQVLDKLRGMKDVRKQDEIGVALFGTQWEDTMKLVIHNVDMAKGKVEEFKGSTDNLSTGAITEVDKLQRRWDEFTSDFGEDVATVINHQKDFMDSQNTAIGSLFGFGDGIQDANDHLNSLGFGIDGANGKVIGLAESLANKGVNAFGQAILKMSEADLKVLGLKYSMDTLAGRVYTLPDGKTITINANTGEVVNGVENVRRSIASLPTAKFFTYYMDTVVTGPGTGSLNSLTGALRGRNAAGGAVVGHAVEGGARGGMNLVNEMGPELGRTQGGDLLDLQSGMTIVPAGQAAALQTAAAGGQAAGGMGGRTIVVQLMLDRRVLQSVVVPMVQDHVKRTGGVVQTSLGRGQVTS